MACSHISWEPSVGSPYQPGLGVQGCKRQGSCCQARQNSHGSALPYGIYLHLG